MLQYNQTIQNESELFHLTQKILKKVSNQNEIDQKSQEKIDQLLIQSYDKFTVDQISSIIFEILNIQHEFRTYQMIQYIKNQMNKEKFFQKIFNQSNQEFLDEFINILQPELINSNSLIYKQGQRYENIYFILQGDILEYQHSSNEDKGQCILINDNLYQKFKLKFKNDNQRKYLRKEQFACSAEFLDGNIIYLGLDDQDELFNQIHFLNHKYDHCKFFCFYKNNDLLNKNLLNQKSKFYDTCSYALSECRVLRFNKIKFLRLLKFYYSTPDPNIVNYLKSIQFFNQMDFSLFQKLRIFSQNIKTLRNQIISRIGEKIQYLYVIKQGEISIQKQQRQIKLLGPNQMFGFEFLQPQQRNLFDYISNTQSELIQINIEEFIYVSNNHEIMKLKNEIKNFFKIDELQTDYQQKKDNFKIQKKKKKFLSLDVQLEKNQLNFKQKLPKTQLKYLGKQHQFFKTYLKDKVKNQNDPNFYLYQRDLFQKSHIPKIRTNYDYVQEIYQQKDRSINTQLLGYLSKAVQNIEDNVQYDYYYQHNDQEYVLPNQTHYLNKQSQLFQITKKQINPLQKGNNNENQQTKNSQNYQNHLFFSTFKPKRESYKFTQIQNQKSIIKQSRDDLSQHQKVILEI